MKLTELQQSRFWREWTAVCRAQRWIPASAEHALTKVEIDRERHALLQRCGFGSLTEVDRCAGFDRVLAELGVLRENVRRAAEAVPGKMITLRHGGGSSQVEDTPGLRRRLLFNVLKHLLALGGEVYLKRFGPERFRLCKGLRGVEDLPTEELHALLVSLAGRRHSHLVADTDASLDSEEGCGDQVEFLPETEEAVAECPF